MVRVPREGFVRCASQALNCCTVMFPGDREQGSGKKNFRTPEKFFQAQPWKNTCRDLKNLIWWARGKTFPGLYSLISYPFREDICTRSALGELRLWLHQLVTNVKGEHRRVPPFVCSELLQDFSETRIKVFHGLERPPKTRLEKNSQRHGPGTLSVRVFEPQYWSEGVWQKNFSSTEKFCLLQTLARCLGGTGWTWNKLLAAWKVYFGGFGIYLLPLHSRLVLSKFNSTTCLNHQNKLSSSPKVLFHGSVPSTCPNTAHTA